MTDSLGGMAESPHESVGYEFGPVAALTPSNKDPYNMLFTR